MSKLCYLLPGLVAAIALSGCGESKTTKPEDIEVDLCQAVDCHDPTGKISCEPSTGLCKCGGANLNGVACGTDEVCVLDESVTPPSAKCVSERCESVTCKAYEACDARDGECKCGGVKCGPRTACIQGECVPNTLCEGVTCREGETCDPTTGICGCGVGDEAEICSAGESCRPGDEEDLAYCVGKNCDGMNCLGDTECSPVDGLCHCGGPSGPVCTTGQSCEVDEATGEARCVGTDICKDKVCEGGTTCSPLDGKCRCAGFGTTAPICGEGQTCDLISGQCLGGDKCANVNCDSKLSCDNEEGICKCGGTGGVVCAPNQGCVKGLDTALCVTKCNPLTPNVEVDVCGQETGTTAPRKGCYYSPVDDIAFCSDAGTASDLQACEKLTDCAQNHHCVEGSSGKVCRPYCDVEAKDGESNACWGADRVCRRLAGSTIANLGVCMSLNN